MSASRLSSLIRRHRHLVDMLRGQPQLSGGVVGDESLMTWPCFSLLATSVGRVEFVVVGSFKLGNMVAVGCMRK
jgi:hypothetical protein